MTRRLLLAGVLMLALLAVATAAAAQEVSTRAQTIADAQAALAEDMTAYEPGKAERIMLAVKQQFVDTPDGFYPFFDSVYSGGGFTAGAGYRRFYGDRTFFDARGLLSMKAYKLVELSTSSLGLGRDGALDLRAVGGWRDATQVNFYGVGGTTAPEDRTNFRMQQAYAGGRVRSRGPARTLFDLALLYEDYTLESGTGTTPSIEEVYTADTAPGLGAEPAYLHLAWTGGIDTRPSPGYARSGGLYAVTYDAYVDIDETYSFDRLQGEVVQHVPFLRETWVLSLHGVARTTLHDDDTVPFFLLPALGSGSTLRAYPSWRFRDRHSLLLSGEWRWIPNRQFVDMAFFADAGKVAARREDLNFTSLTTDVGVGIRFHTTVTTPLRVDVAHGREGFNIVFSGAAAF